MAQAMQLETLIAKAREHRMSPSERRQQRISMIMGLRSNHSTLTREKVEDVLEEVEGFEATPD